MIYEIKDDSLKKKLLYIANDAKTAYSYVQKEMRFSGKRPVVWVKNSFPGKKCSEHFLGNLLSSQELNKDQKKRISSFPLDKKNLIFFDGNFLDNIAVGDPFTYPAFGCIKDEEFYYFINHANMWVKLYLPH